MYLEKFFSYFVCNQDTSGNIFIGSNFLKVYCVGFFEKLDENPEGSDLSLTCAMENHKNFESCEHISLYILVSLFKTRNVIPH